MVNGIMQVNSFFFKHYFSNNVIHYLAETHPKVTMKTFQQLVPGRKFCKIIMNSNINKTEQTGKLLTSTSLFKSLKCNNFM